jgi:hypothetical protein
LTQVLIARQHDRLRVNFLFALILPFREWIDQFVANSGGGPTVVAQVVSSLVVAVFFPAALSPLRSQVTSLRFLAFFLCALLALMSSAWVYFPNL